MTGRRRFLQKTIDRETVQNILRIGREFDLDKNGLYKNGLYDPRSGVVNIWVSPDDKPQCWSPEVTHGGLEYPRAYCGALGWEVNEEDQYELYIEATPYDLHDAHIELTDEDWDEIMDWVHNKVMFLIRTADIHPEVLGIKCPFCDYIMPRSEPVINRILEHIGDNHEHVRELRVGSPATIVTASGVYELQEVMKGEQ